jgi:hypothetical protein
MPQRADCKMIATADILATQANQLKPTANIGIRGEKP